MTSTLRVLLSLLAISAAYAAPSINSAPETYQEYPPVIPAKRAALVLDRLLVALQRALHEDASRVDRHLEREGPQTAPLRLAAYDQNDMIAVVPSEREWGVKAVEALPPRPAALRDDDLQEDPTSALQRRGQGGGGGRGRVLRCYFNAVTCF